MYVKTLPIFLINLVFLSIVPMQMKTTEKEKIPTLLELAAIQVVTQTPSVPIAKLEHIDKARDELLKQYFLKHGRFPNERITGFSYDFSVQDLVNLGCVDFKTHYNADCKGLRLTDLHLNSLSGLATIPNVPIKSVQFIDVSNNKLKNLNPVDLRKFDHLKGMIVSNNLLPSSCQWKKQLIKSFSEGRNGFFFQGL